MISYLAIPYSHPDPRVREMRFAIANFVSAELMRTGEVVFSPISHTHPMVDYGLPTDWEYWKSQDTAFLKICTSFKIAEIKGWDKSSGVAAEKSHMEERGIVPKFVNPFVYDGFSDFIESKWEEICNKYDLPKIDVFEIV